MSALIRSVVFDCPCTFSLIEKACAGMCCAESSLAL